ncbi:MAG: aldo/keto reductase [Fibrobacteria bacterium]|nr:aldo/keto reductase [Fibrobacteria bacterium]
MISAVRTLELGNGVRIARIGLGVSRAGAGESKREAVGSAVACGYRHIDTAAVYGNDADVGEAILRSGILRDEVFVTRSS